MNHAFGKRWTRREDAFLRSSYVRLGAPACAVRLPGRTLMAIHARAVRLGIMANRPWTQADHAQLSSGWGLLSTRQLARRLDRTPDAIYTRATILGIVGRERAGKESLSEAAKRCGYTRQQLKKILEAEEALTVATSRCLASYKLRPKYLLDRDEVDMAISSWLSRENVAAAAKRRGLRPGRLLTALKRIGVTRPAKLPPRVQWRIDDETVDRALREA